MYKPNQNITLSKRIFSILLLSIFLAGVGCSNIGRPPKKHHKGPKIKSSGKMHRFK